MSSSSEMCIHIFDQDKEAEAKAKAEEFTSKGFQLICDSPKLVTGNLEFNPTQSSMCTSSIQTACSQVWVVIVEKA
ncbi:hypothetical protein JCM17961_45260 [Endothiovibrio diazotrophicus]